MIKLVNHSPKFSTAPTISEADGVLTVSTYGDDVSYQWYRDGSAILGATERTFAKTASDNGSGLKCLVTLTDGGGKTAAAWTNEVDVYVDHFIATQSDADALGELTPRSRLYFKAGETFIIGDITLPYKSTISKYGVGDDPILLGSVDISTATWTDEGDNTWSCEIEEPNWIFIDGELAKLATSDWFHIASRPTSNSIRLTTSSKTAVEALDSIVGAKLRMYRYTWIISVEFTVTAYDDSTGDITLDADHVAGQNEVFYLYGQMQHFTDLGEWYYEDGKLYYKSDVDPSTLDIRATYYDHAVVIGGHNVTIENVTIKQYHLSGIFNTTGLYLTVDGVTVSDIHNHGIFSKLPATITDSTITKCNCQGVDASDSYVANCTINYIGVGLNFPMPDTDLFGDVIMGSGIETDKMYQWYWKFVYSRFNTCYYNGKVWMGLVQGNENNIPEEGDYWTEIGDYVPDLLPTHRIYHNVIHDVARSPIRVFGSYQLEVSYNLIYNFMRRARDGGAINFLSNHPIRQGRLASSFAHVHHNIIYGGARNVDDGVLSGDQVRGIYLDNYSLYFTVEYNTLICAEGDRMDYGIVQYVPTKANTVRNNTVIGCSDQQHYIYQHISYSSYPEETGLQRFYTENIQNVATGNIYITKRGTQRCIRTRSIDGSMFFNPFTGGDCDNNKYINPYGTVVNTHQGSSSVDYDLDGWRTKNGDDANSTERTNFRTYVNEAASDIDVRVEYNATDEAVEFNIPSGYTDVDGNAPSNPYTIQPFESLVYIIEP